MKSRLNNKILLIGLICFLLAFMVTAQIRTINVSETDISRLKKENELRDEINQWKDVYDTATERINELNAKISEYQTSAAEDDKTVALIKSDLDNARVLAGLVSVEGQGIIITLDDTEALKQIALDAGYYDPNAYIIHDSDLVMIVNELLSAGAEAISINGQRITGRTEIRCTGPQVLINGIRIVAPFKVSAIGDSSTLKGALSLRGGIISSIKADNIDVTITTSGDMIVPAYEKTITYQYAKPVEEGVGK
ncbi:MAG: DUF881 domain-containing protein [Clostridia bacterium]|nr:DUF881 domain-containing protein [Clostridia bacterium]